MNEIGARCNRTELNNNGDVKQAFSQEYASSSSDTSEVSSVQDAEKDNPPEEQLNIHRARSMSDGAPTLLSKGDVFEVFPSLPDSVLEKLGLLGNGKSRDGLTDADMEHKFVSLSLAFTIDAATITDRSERQRRYRDQTETNLNVEIDRLIAKAKKLQPLCVDAETTELLTGLLAQVDLIIRATAHAATSAERFGAVQHEQRISESVQLMIGYVNSLKEQREAAKRQLQYTKKVLQDTNPVDPNNRQRSIHSQLNGRAITRRRASIATITQPQQEPVNKIQLGDTKRITRRTSESTIKGGSMMRASRPSRLDLNMMKICENIVEINTNEAVNEELDDVEDSNSCQSNDESRDMERRGSTSRKLSQEVEDNNTPLPLRNRLVHRLKRMGKTTEHAIKDWMSSGASNEVFCFCALMCFSLSIITMGNIFIELEIEKRGQPFYFWNLNFLWGDNSAQEFPKGVLDS